VVTVRRSSRSEGDPHRQDKIELVEALIRAIDNIDEINAAVRASVDGTEAKTALMAAPFLYSEEQAIHILSMTVGSQTQAARKRLKTELARLRQGK